MVEHVIIMNRHNVVSTGLQHKHLATVLLGGTGTEPQPSCSQSARHALSYPCYTYAMTHSLTVRLNGSTEIELMQLVWSHHYTTSLELTSSIQRTRQISINTVNAILENMIEKGLLSKNGMACRKHLYTATFTKVEYLTQAIDTVLSTFTATPTERLCVFDSLQTNAWIPQLCQPILGRTELAIMQIIWLEGYRFGREIVPSFQGRYTHPIQIVNTILVDLARKGLLKQERPVMGKRPYSYTPALSRTEYLAQEVERMLSTVATTSAERACLVDALKV